jgi:hypothetical protein
MDNSRSDLTVLVRDTEYHISEEKIVADDYSLLGSDAMQGPTTPIFRAAGSTETLLHFN